MGAKVTRDDVAKAAGVSTATVSRVFNHLGTVDKELSRRVLAVANNLNYTPNAVARSLKTRETCQLAYIVGGFSNPIYAEVASAFQGEAFRHGYTINLCIADESFDSYMDIFMRHRVDGILFGSLPQELDPEKLKVLADFGIPLVVNCTVTVKNDMVSVVDTDFEDGVNQALEHLVSLGHKRIGYVDGIGRGTNYDIRYKAFVKFQLDHNLPFNTDHVVFNEAEGKHDNETGYLLMKALLDRVPDITAVMCTNDFMALGAMNAIRDRGLKIPEDISIVGYDNIVFGELTAPKLTTVHLPKSEIGVKAVELIVRMRSGEKSLSEKLPAKLIVRESTGPVRP